MTELSRSKIKKELEAVKDAIKKLEEMKQKAIDGIEVNKIVLEAFENLLR